MREPDLTAELAEGCPALSYQSVAIEAARAFAAMQGVSGEAFEEAAGKTREAFAGLGLVVRAWKLDHGAEGARLSGAAVRSWIIEGPFNLMWQRWLMAAIHLRDVEGVDPPKIVREGATHEVVIVSLDPNGPRNIDKIEAGKARLRFLQPMDLVHQVVGLTDEGAAELVDLSVQAIARGEISPDQDWRQAWAALLDKTVEHLRYGGHPEFN